MLLTPLYRSGVAVVSVDGEISAGAAGPGGLWPGDEISAINNCQVNKVADWESCLQKFMLSHLEGGCLSMDFVLGAAVLTTNGSVSGQSSALKKSCCSPGIESPTDLCFFLDPVLKRKGLALDCFGRRSTH